MHDAILLAAGVGSRLQLFTDTTPKPLLTVGQRSVLEHNLDALRRAGVRRVFVNLHAHSEQIERYLRASDWGMEVLTRREPRLTGPAGGAALFRDDLVGLAALVVSADAVHAIDLVALADRHQARRSLLTVAVRSVTDAHRFGVPEIDHEDRITAFVEKPVGPATGEQLVSCGIYCVDRAVLRRVDRTRVVDFGRDLIPALAQERNDVFAFRTQEYWLDMGTPQSLLRANLDAAQGFFDSRPRGPRGEYGWVAATARIHPSVQLKGPLIIGEKVVVKAAAVIEGPAVIGDGCIVAQSTLIREAVLMAGATTGPGDQVLSTIIPGRAR